MEIRVFWERTLNVKPYESLKISLGIVETVLLPEEKPGGGVPAGAVAAVARTAVEYERVFFDQLAKLGNTLTEEQLSALQAPTPAPSAQGESGSLYPTAAPPVSPAPRGKRL